MMSLPWNVVVVAGRLAPRNVVIRGNIACDEEGLLSRNRVGTTLGIK
jgi:hypothetical protein